MGDDMKLLDTTHALFSPEVAIVKAAVLKAGDPEWDYIVIHDPTGRAYSFIEIYDEGGEFVGRL